MSNNYFWSNFGMITPQPSTVVTGLDPASTSHTILQDIGNNSHAAIDGHIATSNNPHGGTLTQTSIIADDISAGLITCDDISAPLGKLTTLRCAEIDQLETPGLLITTPIIQSAALTNNLTPYNVLTTNAGPAYTFTRTPATEFVTPASANTLTNKTINTGVNTIQVSSAANFDINNLINQPLLTSSNVTFNALSATGVKPIPTSAGIHIGRDGAGHAGIEITGPNANSFSYIDFSFPPNDYRGRILYSNTLDEFNILTGASPVVNMTINSSAVRIEQALRTDTIVDKLGGNLVSINGATAVNTTGSATLSSKTINSGVNTIEISSAVNQNINNLLSQDVRPSADVAFSSVFCTNPSIMGATKFNGVVQLQTINNQLGAIELQTSNITRLRILSSGIPQDDTNVNILTIDNSTLKYRSAASLISANPFNQTLNTTDSPTFSNLTMGGQLRVNSIVDTLAGNNVAINNDIAVNISNIVTLTGKTIPSLNNTITISAAGGANINNLINQDVRTSANVNFNSVVSLTGMTLSGIGGQGTLTQLVNSSATALRIPVKGTIPANGSLVVHLQNTSTDQGLLVIFSAGARGVSSPTEGIGEYLYSYRVYNNNGVLDISTGLDSGKAERNIAGGFGGKLSVVAASVATGFGPAYQLSFVSSASFACTYGGTVDIRYLD